VQPIRTASELAAHIVIQRPTGIALYQKPAKKVGGLHMPGMSIKNIADSLNVSLMTVKRVHRLIH
jgi:hypothetical protein